MALRPLKPEILISWTMTGRMTLLQRQILGLSATPSSKKLTPIDCNNNRQTDNRKWKHRRLGPKLEISGSRSLSKSFGYTFIEIVIIENPEFVVGISMLSVIVPDSRDITTSGFDGHLDISGCRSLLYSLVNTIFHLYRVLNHRFVVRILTVLFMVSEI